MCLRDGDDTHKPRFIHGMLAKITREKQCVIASRYQPGAPGPGAPGQPKALQRRRSPLLHVGPPRPWGEGLYLRLPGVYPPALQAGVARYGQALVEKKSFACMMELLYKLYRCGCTFAEVPFTLYYDSKEGESKMNLGKTIRTASSQL